MPALRDRVLELLRGGERPVAVRELVRRLGLNAPARKELRGVLRELIDQGEVLKIRGGRVGVPSRMNLVVGRLSCSPGGYGFVVPDPPRAGQANVYVAAVNLKEALHGDRVVARVERLTPKGPEGRIIRILERAQERIVGRYEEEGRFGGHVVPFDRRILHELFIPPADNGGARPGEMVVAEMTRPPSASRNPMGRVLEILGRLADPGVDLRVVMAKHGLPASFPSEVEAEADRVPHHVRTGDLEGRTDFRGHSTVTIDPETARDHDDALGLEQLPDGSWRLAVHIADVSHYVPEGSALDREAYARGTSVYFPERVVPMLPEALSSHICSLVQGEDRLTQTVLLDLDEAGRVQGREFHDGVIRCDARLSYRQAQGIMDGDADLRSAHEPLVPMLEQMARLARLMRGHRHERGSLDLDLPEPKLVLDEAGEIVSILPAERLESMRLVEEFMLAANEAVAERLAQEGVGTLYRIHEKPDPERLESFCELAGSFGYRLPTGLDPVRPQDFQRVIRQIEGKPEEKLISYLLLRTMKLARYHEENLGHFGLATEMYAHFTSPIRRYPDLVVHRALRLLRNAGSPGSEAMSREALPDMGRHLSEMERRAAEAERELVEWKKVRFMSGRLGERFSGYVTGVQAFGLFVELEEIYVQGLVHVSSMTDDYYSFNDQTHTLQGESTDRCYRLGDRVEVQVARVDLERRQIELALVEILERAADRGGGQRRQRRPAEAGRRGRGGRRR